MCILGNVNVLKHVGNLTLKDLFLQVQFMYIVERVDFTDVASKHQKFILRNTVKHLI